VRDVLRALRHGGGVFVHADFWIAADRPAATARDSLGRPHATDRPAVTWRDGAGLGFLHGVAVDMTLLTQPLSFARVFNEPNAEIRRALIELYERGDQGRFIRDADATALHLDYDKLGHPRRLLRFELANDEPYVAVEVTNSTPEPDGTHKRYYLRVPPNTRTCAEGVAWTFGMTEGEYSPDAES
jgi:hypothetical protein